MPCSAKLSLALAACTLPLFAQTDTAPKADAKPPQTLTQRTASMTHMPGLLPLDWDAKAGKLYLEISLDADTAHTRSQDLLYVTALPWGTGSNDLGLDRGQLGRSAIVRFERTGPKLLLVQPNTAFRSSSPDADQQRVVTTSFPRSVMAGFHIDAESPDGATVLVDATDFVIRDAHRVSEAIARAGGGTYRLDPARSAIALDGVKSFPKNTELEAELTFANEGGPDRAAAGGIPAYGGGGGGGRYVRDVSPDPRAMTVHERQSFIELPGPGFTPRRFSPRAGYFPEGYRDYDTPLGEPLAQQFIIRHRLIKRDPNCTKACAAVAPIQYYVDRGAPEPIRSALVEGARWWDQAFQAAGWAPGTFKVDVLPAGADPMDVRYNIIQWVHRYTRGWSYGDAVTDPRTGEIIKGNVTLGSLRGRQDYLIAEALLAPYPRDTFIEYGPGNEPPAFKFVLQRIRQLAAHETGHTLGLAHNFAASSTKFGNHDSVMDYPHPYIELDKNGKISLDHAYAVGIGEWDKVAINYGYREYDDYGKREERFTALNDILDDADKDGQLFITDEDARPFSGAHPHAHLWDNGADPTAELLRILHIREVALKNFGITAIQTGTPMSQLADTLVPLYLLHRYQTEATIKLIGGLDYRYTIRPLRIDESPTGPAIVPLKDQDAALDAVLKTLAPETLTLSENILKLIPPNPPGYPRTQESFPSETGLTFDPIAAAEAAADLTLQVLFDPARASRIVQYHMRDAKGPSLRVMMESVSKTTAERPEGGHTISSEVERAVEFRGLEWMLGLAVNPAASSQARAIARYHIDDLLKQWTTATPPTDSAEAIHRTGMINRINEFERDPEKFVPAKPIEAPPGMPIGDDEE
jgi:hypothetical protein